MPFFLIFGLVALAIADDGLTTLIAMLFARFLQGHNTNIIFGIILLESLRGSALFSLPLLKSIIPINLF